MEYGASMKVSQCRCPKQACVKIEETVHVFDMVHSPWNFKLSVVYCSSLPSFVFRHANRFAPIFFSFSSAIWMGPRTAFHFVAVIAVSLLCIIRLDQPDQLVQLCVVGFGYVMAIAVLVATSIQCFERGLWLACANGSTVWGNPSEIIQWI